MEDETSDEEEVEEKGEDNDREKGDPVLALVAEPSEHGDEELAEKGFWAEESVTVEPEEAVAGTEMFILSR